MTSLSNYASHLYPFERRILSLVEAERAHLTNAPRFIARRPRRMILIAAGLAALALVVGPSVIAPHDMGSRAVAVRQMPNGLIQVDLTADFNDGHALAERLRSYGLEVRVVEEEVPASSPYVGMVVSTEIPSEIEAKGIDWNEEGLFKLNIDPTLFREVITIYVGKAQ